MIKTVHLLLAFSATAYSQNFKSSLEQCSWKELEESVKIIQKTNSTHVVQKVQEVLRVWPENSKYRVVALEFAQSILDRSTALGHYWLVPSESDLEIYQIKAGFESIRERCVATKFISMDAPRMIKLRDEGLVQIKNHQSFHWEAFKEAVASVKYRPGTSTVIPGWEGLHIETVFRILPPPREPDLLSIYEDLVEKIKEGYSLEMASID